MIRIAVKTSGSHFVSLTITGHGGLEKGYDIYCAGVSSCLYGALNALNEAENFTIRLESGDAEVVAKSIPSPHDEIVMETLITQLATIANSYPKHANIQVSEKEGSK